jgi:hypothetical protein
MISIENNIVSYPIHIEIPEGYWTYSCTIIKNSSEENKEN